MPMRLWNVQWAYGLGVGVPEIYKDPELAKNRVAGIIVDFLLPTLDKNLEFNRSLDQNMDYVADGERTSEAIKSALERDEIWEAYDLWHDFLIRYDDRWTFPAWVKLGQVIVDTRDVDGPRNRKKTLPLTDVAPITQYDPGEGLVMAPGEEVDEDLMKQIERMRIEAQSRPPYEMEGYSLGVMKLYKVQWGYSDDIGTPMIHKSEEKAKAEVTHLLGNWIMENLDSYWRTIVNRRGEHQEFVSSAQLLVPQVKGLIAQGDVWTAYELWQEFYDRYEFEFGYPLFVAIGTVLLETNDPAGPARHRGLMRRGSVPPKVEHIKSAKKPVIFAMREEHEAMSTVEDLLISAAEEVQRRGVKITVQEFDNIAQAVFSELAAQGEPRSMEEARAFMAKAKEEILRRIGGLSMGGSLGAMTRWLVQYADMGGAWHPGVHTNEEMAKGQAREILERLMSSMAAHVNSENRARGRVEYARAGIGMLSHLQWLLDNGMVWAAYLDFRQFQRDWGHVCAPIPIEYCFGTMRVTPEPEPESGPQGCEGAPC